MRIISGLLIGCAAVSGYGKSADMNPAPDGGEWLRMSGGLLIVLLIIAVLVWILRRMQAGGFSLSRGIRCMGGMNLGARERLVLIEIGGRFLLLGVTSTQVNLIYDFGETAPEGFDTVNKSTFSAFLQTAMGRKE